MHDSDGAAGRDAAEVLADYLAATRYDDLPGEVIAAVKRQVLDTLGCVLAGTGCTDVVAMRRMVRGWNARPQCTVIGAAGLKTAPQDAILLNGAAIHQFDFDDTHDAATCHPSSSSLVPALAALEARGGGDGRALIRALALGNEVTSRVSFAVLGKAHDYPWFRAPVVGLFGATAAVATVLGASARQIVEAFGLALPQVGGTWASLEHPGSSVRSIRDGLMYRSGLVAAELAINGIRGDRRVFDGPWGFYHTYFGGNYDRERLVGELGARHEAARISLKPWPSIRHLHGALTATLDAMRTHGLRFEDVAGIDVAVGKVNRDRGHPVTFDDDGDGHIDLLHNLHFAIANAILNGGMPLSVYRDRAQARRVVELAMPKVRWHYDPQQDGPWTFEAGRVRIDTVDGRSIDGYAPVALGHPDNPMSESQRIGKFLDCVSNAAEPVDAARAQRIVELVDRLETLDSLEPLLQALAG